jgi:ATP-binding cassette subfamily C protein
VFSRHIRGLPNFIDEPTSNLDSLNEAVILKSLREERDGKTVVLVSHRQSTMRIADIVYSVESLSQTAMALLRER